MSLLRLAPLMLALNGCGGEPDPEQSEPMGIQCGNSEITDRIASGAVKLQELLASANPAIQGLQLSATPMVVKCTDEPLTDLSGTQTLYTRAREDTDTSGTFFQVQASSQLGRDGLDVCFRAAAVWTALACAEEGVCSGKGGQGYPGGDIGRGADRIEQACKGTR